METTPKDQACSLTSSWTLIQKPLRAEVTHNSTVLWMSFNNDDSAPVEPVFVSRADYYRLARHPPRVAGKHSCNSLRGEAPPNTPPTRREQVHLTLFLGL